MNSIHFSYVLTPGTFLPPPGLENQSPHYSTEAHLEKLDQEIEFFIKSDLTWHKSTKKFGSSENFFNILWNNALEDKLNIFNSSNFKDFKKTKISQTDRDALHVLELNDNVKWEQIQLKFKELVKKYHPDKNQGNKKFEEKLKKITLAYSQLKKTLGKK